MLQRRSVVLGWEEGKCLIGSIYYNSVCPAVKADVLI